MELTNGMMAGAASRTGTHQAGEVDSNVGAWIARRVVVWDVTSVDRLPAPGVGRNDVPTGFASIHHAQHERSLARRIQCQAIHNVKRDLDRRRNLRSRLLQNLAGI